ncbi:30S ribosomal protein S8 [Candidatus Woesearchaeota archaeon]|nr:30S ribosomal protein S8 [Candidatus Woesearchaeota archaeon]
MTLNDTLANALSRIEQHEKLGRKECAVESSKLVKNVLGILKQFGYIKDFSAKKEGAKEILTVQLSGAINSVGVVKPRFPLQTATFTKWEKRYLPSKDMGILVLSTVEGLMDHAKAKEKHMGGRILAYCY